ncbi:MAG: DegT/DnrJ/EryC1/StrS family aminotransferase [Acidobacteriota bacterium]
MIVPFFRPAIGEGEINEVVETLRSGWLTTGARAKRFESEFAAAVGAPHALAVNSCTAALHLAVEALGLCAGEAVLVPTMTFAATAEVVRYLGAIPVLVDCEPDTLLLDRRDVAEKAAALAGGRPVVGVTAPARLAGIIPVHVAGVMVDLDWVSALAREHGLWVVEDAAHSFPAAWRASGQEAWRACGAGGSDVACFSFYANKTITTGEGGMATTHRPDLADRMRVMSLHGISRDAWKRYSEAGSWYYEIAAPGFKYNLTDVAAAIGLAQLARAEALLAARERIAHAYLEALADCTEVELPPAPADRRHSWHLFYLRLRLDRLRIDRAAFIEELKRRGVLCSVHWMPLHLHPYYRDTFGLRPEDFPVATALWPRLVSLPIFPAMSDAELAQVVTAVKEVCRRFARQ